MRLIIDGKDQVPDAQTTPAGRPDTSTEEQVAANAKMLWLALRETIRHANGSLAPDRRDDIGGLLWRGNPMTVAAALWDGMDSSDITAEAAAVLYEHLRLTRHLIRVDEGGQGRKWWVADQWDDTRVPTREQPRGLLPAGEPAVRVPGRLTGQIVIRDDGPAVWGDPADALQSVLTEITRLRAENQHLRATIAAQGDTAEMAADNLRLRGENQGLRASNTRLRAYQARASIILGQEIDDIP